MKKNLSVLQISPFFLPNVGGVETHLNDLISFLESQKVKNSVITYQPLVGKERGQNYQKIGQTQIYRIPYLKGLFYKTEKNPLIHFLYLTPGLLMGTLWLLNKNRNQINLVHAHGVNAAVIGAIAKSYFKKPLVISFHVEFNLSKEAFSTKIILKALKAADKILVLTQRSRQALIELGIPAGKIELYSYWVDQKTFQPQNKTLVRKKIGWDQKFSVLFVGRLAEEKGVRLLLEVAKKLPQVKFVIAGTGDLDSLVQGASQVLHNLIYLGKVDNDKLVNYYNSADLLVVPSLVKDPKPSYEEGVPRVMIEALSCGLPVIGTDNGGIKEVILQGKVGVVIDSKASDLTAIISKLKSSPQKLKDYSLNARRYALDKFGKVNGAVISQLYQDIASQEEIKQRLDPMLGKVGDMALKRRAKSVVLGLELETKKKILDVGCGDGFYLHLLSNLGVGVDLTGTDFDQNGLNSARKNLETNIPLIQADLMEKLPFEPSSFDGVVMSEVAEHLPSDKEGLSKVYQVLKPGGILVLTVPSQDYPLFWDPVNWVSEQLFKTHIKSGFWAGIWNQHIRLYRQKQIEEVVKSAGFTIEESQLQTYWCLPFSHNLINLGARLLAQGHLSTSIKQSASKFSKTPNKQLNLATVFFAIANGVDKLNQVWPVKSAGVSVFIKAKKVL